MTDDVAALIACAQGTLAETRAQLQGRWEQAAQLVLEEVAVRASVLPGPDRPAAVQLELVTPDAVLEYVLDAGPDGPALRRGTATDPPVRLRQELGELVRAVYGSAAAPHDATRAIWIMNEPGPQTDDPDDPWLGELRAATLAAAQIVRACSPYRMPLDALAQRFGSDKWGDHLYTEHYERHLARYRDSRIRLLEIGVGGFEDPCRGGESLRMWKHYFPRGLIHGLDLYDKTPLEEPRIRTFVGDQSDRAFLAELAARIGPLDVVVDDGSHVSDHVVASFQALFPLLEDGGTYVVEDLQTAYWPGWNGGRDDLDDPGTTTGFVKRLVDGLHHQDQMPARADRPLLAIERHVRAIHLYHNLLFVEKGVNAEQTAPSWVRRFENDMDLVPKGSMRRVTGPG